MKIRAIVSLLALTCALPLVGCNSSDDPSTPEPPETSVSPNIDATRALVEQAQQDWQGAGLQSYAYTEPFRVLTCDGGYVFTPMSVTHIVPDNADPYRVYPAVNAGGGDSSYLSDGSHYERVHERLLDILDKEPVRLSRTAQNFDELPTFTGQGLVERWYHRENSEEQKGCHYTVATRLLVPLNELSYPLHDYAQAVESGFATWQAAGLQDYTYRARFISGACEAPNTSSLATIRVIDGKVEDIEWDGDDRVSLSRPTIVARTFDQFAYVLSILPGAVSAGVDSDEPVQFDPNFGFPLSFYAEDSHAGAEECFTTGIIIESFE